MNESMIFYRSFYEAVKLLPPELRLQAYDVIMAYGIDGAEPEEMEDFVKMVFTLIKPQIDANSRRRSNGGKGGRPTETNGYEDKKPMVMESETEIKTNGYANEKPMVMETETETETIGYPSGKPNVNVKDNVKDNVNVNDKERESRTKRAAFVPPSIDDIRQYETEKGYTPSEAETIFNFYNSKGWMVGKNKMTSWRSAVSGWHSRDKNRASPKRSFTAMTGRDNTDKYAELEVALLGRATG